MRRPSASGFVSCQVSSASMGGSWLQVLAIQAMSCSSLRDLKWALASVVFHRKKKGGDVHDVSV